VRRRTLALAALLTTLSLLVGPDRRAPAAAETVRLEPNSYELAGGGLRVTYLTEGGRARPGPTLRYQDASHSLLFTGDDIRTEETALGRLVTVTLRMRVDVDRTTFTLVVPHVNLGPGGEATIRTIGITTLHREPFTLEPPVGPVETYRVTRLAGTARHVAF
jgi:hypothetical protein